MKTVQGMITLVVFWIYLVLYLKEELKWNHLAGVALLVGAAFLNCKEWG